MFEFIVFFTTLKYIFIEGGEQALVGIETASRIGKRKTLKITIFGLGVGIVLYFFFLNVADFVPTNILEIALGIGLLFFSGLMFKEFFENETKVEKKTYELGYFYIAMLEAVENSVALAAFSLIDLPSAIIGFFVAIGVIIFLLYLKVITQIPIRITRLVAGVLLASTGIPLVLYGLYIPTPEFIRWIIPPLSELPVS